MSQMLPNILKAPQVMFAKGSVLRDQYPLEIDLSQYVPEDYDIVVPMMQEVERQLLSVPLNSKGMRWIHFAETVYFWGERHFDIDFDDFVARVDISHVGDFYRDSISLKTQVVEYDPQGRPIRQNIRVVALPQPNYSALMGKDNLDVYKLEKVDFSKDEHKVWMRTVHSPNGSAICDDGYTSFQRSQDGKGTRVVFLACQNFPVPPLMALMQLDKWTWLKRMLTESAYQVFCNRMMKNIMLCYHGKEYRTGKHPR
jgi:hypothetical protein